MQKMLYRLRKEKNFADREYSGISIKQTHYKADTSLRRTV